MILNSPYISGSLTVTGNEVVSGSLTVLGGITLSGSIASASYATNAELLDGLDSSVFVLSSSFQNYSSSNDGKVAALNTFSASILSYTSSTDDKIAQLNRETASLNLATASINNATASLYASTASLYNFSSSANLRIGSLEQYTQSLNTRSASFACVTATNNFACTQYFSNTSNAVSFTSTGSLYSDGGIRITKDMYVSGTAFFNNVTVFGTQSVAYISSSQLNIGTNIISVNTDTPSIRFGGLAVYDSGSTGLTGSMLWDSEDNQWIYSNPSGSAYDSAVFLVGPRNVGTLGNEPGISCNFLSKGNGMHHMTSSGIFEDGSRTCFYGNASISSAGAACLAGTICSPSMDVMPSGIGSSTLGGIMRVVTAGTSTGIAVGQSNTNRYTHIAANDIQVFNDDFFLSTRCAFPLSIGTCYTARLTFAATGIACFACQVCASAFQTPGCIAVASTSWIGFNGFDRTHAIGYDATVDGVYVRGQNGLRFITGAVGGTERMRLDVCGNLGLGVTPSAWFANFKGLQLENGSLFGYSVNRSIFLTQNSFFNTSGSWIYSQTAHAAQYSINGTGEHQWYTAPSGTAGNAISFTQAMTLNACGRLILGNTTDNTFSRLQVAGGAWIGQNAGRGLYFADGTSYTSVVGVNQAVTSYNAIELRASGTDGQLFLSTGGNVGVGTTNPSDTLTITDASTYTFNIGAACGGAGAVLYTLGSAALTFATCGKSNERIRITNTGILGFNGSSVPGNAGLDKMSMGYLNGNYGWIQTWNGTPLILNREGNNVGINTSVPTTKLSVNSGISVSSANAISIMQNTNGANKDAAAFGVSINNGGESTNAADLYISTATGGALCERMRITSTGVACFSCQVCAPLYIGSLRGQATIAKAVGSMNNGGGSQLIYLTSNVNVGYGINDYSITVFAAGNAAEQSSVRVLSAYGYYASSVTTTELSKFIDNSQGHSQISFGICKASGSSNTYCYAVCFAKSSGVISGYCVNVVKNSSSAGDAGDMSLY